MGCEKFKDHIGYSEPSLNGLFYCDDCSHLRPKESEQVDKEPHRCWYFNIIMKHNGEHPHIPAPENCMGYDKQ